jgi:hypothetical protein
VNQLLRFAEQNLCTNASVLNDRDEVTRSELPDPLSRVNPEIIV